MTSRKKLTTTGGKSKGDERIGQIYTKGGTSGTLRKYGKGPSGG